MSTESHFTDPKSTRRGCSPKGCGLFLLLAIPVLLTLYFLFIAIENWRGARAWARAVAAVEAAGETVDMKAFLGQQPSIADTDNFAATPLLDSLVDFSYENIPSDGSPLTEKGETIYHQAEQRQRFLKLSLPKLSGEKPKSGNWKKGEALDLTAWHTALLEEGSLNLSKEKPAAQAIVEAIDLHAGDVLTELAAAAKLPHGRFKQNQPLETFLDAVGLAVPHCHYCTKAIKTLNLYATAALANGDPDSALEAILIGLRLAETNGSSHHLIGVLVEITGHQVIANSIWEGLRSEAWNEDQLTALDTMLARPDLLAAGYYAMQGEMALFTGSFRQFTHEASGSELASMTSQFTEIGVDHKAKSMSANLLFHLLFHLLPKGWIDQNCALAADLHLKYALNPLREKDIQTLLKDSIPPELARTTPYNLLTKISFPVYSGISRRYIATDSLLRLARAACKIERYKQRTGSYPENLAILGDDLPLDLITGAPFNYAATADGRYKLWSIGMDGEDAGGRIALRSDGQHIDDTKGDWVWAYRPEVLLPVE